MPEQLRLFESPKPLLDRLGPEFFRRIPRRPGVYIMCGADERVLYIGQSKNLRSRVSSYKNANPERMSRKTVRLVHRVRSLVWEECESPQAARLRENELLRIHRPTFNRVNTYPKAYCFLSLRLHPERLGICWTTEGTLEPPVYGAFKRGAVLGYSALLRSIWAAIYQPTRLEQFPVGLLSDRPPRKYSFDISHQHVRPIASDVARDLPPFLEGTGGQLLDLFESVWGQIPSQSPFQRSLWQADLEILKGFYQSGPERNFRLRTEAGIPGPIILQEELDDLLVKVGPNRAAKHDDEKAESGTPQEKSQ